MARAPYEVLMGLFQRVLFQISGLFWVVCRTEIVEVDARRPPVHARVDLIQHVDGRLGCRLLRRPQDEAALLVDRNGNGLAASRDHLPQDEVALTISYDVTY